LTIPLTHLVNYIDDRLRRGRTQTEPDDPLDPASPMRNQEMV
jgi:polar amino acid transport system substrate-binding protein